ncbi:MAG: phosphotransferase [Thermoplasmata archaeon]
MQVPVVREGDVASWCTQWLNAGTSRALFRSGHLSVVLGLALDDGREVVLKVRAPSSRINACVEVQRGLWQAGFPCPQPLAGPAPWETGGYIATAEAFVSGGVMLRSGPDSPRLFGSALERLVRSAPALSCIPSLDPPPPWFGAPQERANLWPSPPDRDYDLNEGSEPDWIDDIARRVRKRLHRSLLPFVVGHGDWESQNIRWNGTQLYVVHDWDSAVAGPEAVIAGAGAAAFPAEEKPSAARLEESEVFLASYSRARGHPWSHDEGEVAWASGLWLMAYNAKIESLDGGPSPVLDRLASEAEARLRRAGA